MRNLKSGPLKRIGFFVSINLKSLLASLMRKVLSKAKNRALASSTKLIYMHNVIFKV